MTVQPFAPRRRPSLEDLVRAEEARAMAPARKTPSNPFVAPTEPERRTYADPTADEAIANVMREQRGRR